MIKINIWLDGKFQYISNLDEFKQQLQTQKCLLVKVVEDLKAKYVEEILCISENTEVMNWLENEINWLETIPEAAKLLEGGMVMLFLTKVCNRFNEVAGHQEGKGIEKYGHELRPADNYDWLEMAEEELVDAFKYIQAEKEVRKNIGELIKAANELVSSIPKSGSKEGRSDYRCFVSCDKVYNLRLALEKFKSICDFI